MAEDPGDISTGVFNSDTQRKPRPFLPSVMFPAHVSPSSLLYSAVKKYSPPSRFYF